MLRSYSVFHCNPSPGRPTVKMATTSKELAGLLNLNEIDQNTLTSALDDYFGNREDDTDNENSSSDGEYLFNTILLYVVTSVSNAMSVCRCQPAEFGNVNKTNV